MNPRAKTILVVAERAVEVQHGLAVAEAELGKPAWVEQALTDGITQGRHAVEMKKAVVGGKEAWLQERQAGGQADEQRQQPDDPAATRRGPAQHAAALPEGARRRSEWSKCRQRGWHGRCDSAG